MKQKSKEANSRNDLIKILNIIHYYLTPKVIMEVTG